MTSYQERAPLRAATPAAPGLGWRRATAADFALLGRWLAQEHVVRWWNHETSPEAVERDFGPSARGEEPSEDWIAVLDGTPLGLVQRCRIADYPEFEEELAAFVAVPGEAALIDYLIGDARATGQGLGPAMIRSMAEKTWREWPDAPAVIAAVAAGNRRSWRALEKAGFVRVASGDLEPDNPVDGPLHHVYRLDRA
jgi:aminoglycoside 6'-N-acetyltransferase